MSLRKNGLTSLGNIGNLFLNAETRVIYQGFTGNQVRSVFEFKLIAGDIECSGYNCVWNKGRRRSITWKGRNSSRIRSSRLQYREGGPISLRPAKADVKAKTHLEPHASAVFVPATLAAKAIEEAIENEIPLVVSVAEGMPAHDCLRVFSFLGDCVNGRSTKCFEHNRNRGCLDPIVLESSFQCTDVESDSCRSSMSH
jgi:succinyl-CoA synthetase alpha subunit